MGRTRLNEDQLKELRTYASLQFSVDEIAVILGVPARAITSMPKADRAYWTSRLKAQAIIRKAAFDKARDGDKAAGEQMAEWAKLSDG